MESLDSVLTHAAALLIGALGMRYEEYRETRHRRALALAAGSEAVRAALKPVTVWLKQAASRAADGRELAERWRTAHDVITDQRHVFPEQWLHLSRSLRDALGEYAGAPSMAHEEYGPEVETATPHDQKWWDNAVTYFEYVSHMLSLLVARPEVARRTHLYDFDEWLARTGRHGTERWLAGLPRWRRWRERMRLQYIM